VPTSEGEVYELNPYSAPGWEGGPAYEMDGKWRCDGLLPSREVTGTRVALPFELNLAIASPGARISTRDALGSENIGTPVARPGLIKPPADGVWECEED